MGLMREKYRNLKNDITWLNFFRERKQNSLHGNNMQCVTNNCDPAFLFKSDDSRSFEINLNRKITGLLLL